MSDRFAIEIEGINDPSLVADIEQTLRSAFLDIAVPGSWRVIVKPALTSGRWDFKIHGLDVRHTLSIAVPPHLLPALIPSRIEAALNRVCSERLRTLPHDRRFLRAV
jgi:hypothetical protein